MKFATHLQNRQYVRDLIDSQNERGEIPAPTASDASSREDRQKALFAGSYRPPCGCDPSKGKVPCDPALDALIAAEPGPGCPNISTEVPV